MFVFVTNPPVIQHCVITQKMEDTRMSWITDTYLRVKM